MKLQWRGVVHQCIAIDCSSREADLSYKRAVHEQSSCLILHHQPIHNILLHECEGADNIPEQR